MKRLWWIAALLTIAVAAPAFADTVKLRSGKVVTGQFIGGDSKSVRVLLDSGIVSEVPLDQAVAVEFSPRKPPSPPPAPPPPPAAKPAPAAAAAAPKPSPPPRKTVTVPSGPALNVRLTEGIDVDATAAGQTFKAVVDDPVMISGSVVIPRGASASLQTVKVEQSGKMKGSDKISLKMNSIRFGGMVYEVTTAYVETKGKGEGKKTARKVGGGAGLGAIVGGIAGGGSGAAIGAAVGAAGGAAVASGGEEHLSLPAETRLTFNLTAAVTVTP
jgi:outer membrane lipoprotein SlyB